MYLHAHRIKNKYKTINVQCSISQTKSYNASVILSPKVTSQVLVSQPGHGKDKTTQL